MLTTASVAISHSSCGRTLTPKTLSGWPPVKDGTGIGSALQIVVTVPRIRIEKPMVMRTDCAMVARRAGRSPRT